MNLTAAFLDYGSLDMNDLDFSSLQGCFSELQLYESTESDQVLERLSNVEVAISNKVRIDAEMLKQLPQLKLILISATGTNNVDLDAAKEQGIVVCNCQGYGTASVAQHTLTLMLALATSLIDYDRAVTQGRWQQSPQFCFLDYPIIELSGKTLGIVGYGELGQEVARLARAFGMQVLIANLPNRPKHANGLELHQLLSQVDFLSLHCPLTEETRNLINADAFALMKTSAFLINCARGGIVHEKDLVDALKQGKIAGAATDVLSVEPPKHGNVLLDANLPNLIITPHSAWGSVQSRQRMVEQLTENAKGFINGQILRQVNA
ncbi:MULTISPECIES: 2-hydroxyacid dehydrogenase [unclassified Acinetobacter]|uniref:2-hydroxyacid dehydrogenase n=1 Tax=unclassified Acinetobacter TaxID=196816 RepID=UPI00190A2477|nr:MULTISPECIES: 2-hydroxyacid dehydrogenase [unclassified Acinetobacter]MBK0064747.1 2-hydroxyacid dehydrogenase [Acinetobacter sp. S55]MBK0068110.1 2-hydroxyacid dehydrogenase [Acinetobacter sp. S54]